MRNIRSNRIPYPCQRGEPAGFYKEKEQSEAGRGYAMILAACECDLMATTASDAERTNARQTDALCVEAD
jgi:hypothetical protein